MKMVTPTRLVVFALVLALGACGDEPPVGDAGAGADGLSALDGTDALGPNDVELVDGGLPEDGLSEDTISDTTDATLADVSPCLSDEEYFATFLWEPTLSTKCFVCHNMNGISKESRLVFVEVESAEDMALNFEVAQELALDEFAGSSTLLLKPTNTHPLGHTGGQQFAVNSQEHLNFKHFVERMNGTADACVPETPEEAVDCSVVKPGPRQVRRLSHFEYDNTISDLFGFESDWGAALTVDDFEHGFDNHGPSLGVSPLLAEQYRKVAEKIAAQAMENKWAVLPCAPLVGSEEDCALEFIETFGPRAFRRPLTQGDISRYKALFDVSSKDDGFDQGIYWVIAAMLQSPNFLYKPELGEYVGDGTYELTGYEIASQLSYFIWGTMPDEPLFESAQSGKLTAQDEILKQAKRLLADPRRLAVVRHFAIQWLDVGRLGISPKDMELFEDYTDDISDAMLEETALFFAQVMFESSGKFPELFTAQHSMINADLAAFYGFEVPGLGDEHVWVDLEGTPYGGVLTHGAVLAAHAFTNSSSPIHRGVMVRERLLCQELPPPPPGIVVQVPPLDPELTTRERFLAHSALEPCSSCHQLIDPIGFAFEKFDAVGRYREEEGGFPIDTSGEIVGSQGTDGTFAGLSGMSSQLSQSQEVQDCFVRQVLRFAYGMGEAEGLGCLIREVQDGFQASELSLPGLVTDLTQTVHFQRREGEEPPAVADEEPTDVVEDTGLADTSEDVGPDPGLIEVDVTMASEWNEGYCADVTVLNVSDQSVVWSFIMPVEGEITTIWNATATEAQGGLEFKGVDWNKELAPGANAAFGFCAAK